VINGVPENDFSKTYVISILNHGSPGYVANSISLDGGSTYRQPLFSGGNSIVTNNFSQFTTQQIAIINVSLSPTNPKTFIVSTLSQFS
jgi:hypothetical protein